ncbi:hypothetical protein E2C01_006522 [Portunus trituberculatus]|uniref:Uncharacterized protein n=1 Tax=Portunus trituberculatus TaxID=210409 RepID=A0A5B7CX34_PORTR|nr:hypothetical protein [Portunus trituberculatus]
MARSGGDSILTTTPADVGILQCVTEVLVAGEGLVAVGLGRAANRTSSFGLDSLDEQTIAKER